MATAQFDNTELTNTIQMCFRYGMDGSIPLADRAQFILQGKRLRGHLVSLLTSWFDDTSQRYIDASTELNSVIALLRDRERTLENIADTIGKIAALVGLVDQLLGVVQSAL